MNREQYQRAFVLQLSETSDPVSSNFQGRVEHVGSGQSTQFDSLAELEAFLAKLLTGIPAARGNEATDTP